MSSFIIYLINQGVPFETIVVILMLPVVALVIAFARQVIGLKGFGMYTPLIVTFAFLATGLKYGLIMFFAVLISGTLVRLAVKKLRLLYLPRMAIILTVVAMIILFIFTEAVYSERIGLMSVPIFPILMIIALVEKFVASQIEKGNRPALLLSLATLVLAIVCYYIASWSWLEQVLLKFPWLILLTIVINIGLGKWTGLRISEYFRFKEVIKNVQISQKK